MTATIIRGDARALPLPDASVDLVVTSPPYYGLRSYTDGGEHYAGQIGAEPTPAEYVAALLECTREWMRVLKPSGSMWVNLGDRYGGGGQCGSVGGNLDNPNNRVNASAARRIPPGIRPKSLAGLPWRYALGCIDDLGLILRAEVIWSKCLSGGTQVYARTKGRVQTIKLHDLCRHYRPEDVQLWTGEKWSQARAWESTPRDEAQYEIELRSGERIGCTPEHRWPTRRGLLRSDELAVGDILDTCDLPDGGVVPSALDDEMIGWFVGLYIAEGSRSEQTIQIAGHVKELDRFKRLCEVAAAFHGTCRVHATGGNAATINLTGCTLRSILDTYVGGRTAKDKHLAPKCWQRSNRFLRAVLDGYLAGDGHWRADANRWVLGFASNDALAADLRALGARLGLSVRLKRTTHTGFGKQWPGWMGNITEPQRRRRPDSEIVAIRPSRARRFWDLAIEDEPHLFALASGVLTHNSNGLPESVTDRVRRSHEQWFHLVTSPRYFSAVDDIREATNYKGKTWEQRKASGVTWTPGVGTRGTHLANETVANGAMEPHPLGKLPGSVWEIATQPLKVPAELGVDHFAAFPMEWPRRIISGWSPAGICTACGAGRRPVPDVSYARDAEARRQRIGRITGQGTGLTPQGNGQAGLGRTTRITGYTCACPDATAPTKPAVVLDPFGGTGTTALVADVLGRHGISVDMSADYCRLARWRTTDPGERARALGVPKPPAVLDGQTDLFEEIA